MKATFVLASFAVAALCAGCADMNSGNHGAGTRAMGAGPGQETLCRDGTSLPPHSRCALHGGIIGGPRTSPSQASGGGGH